MLAGYGRPFKGVKQTKNVASSTQGGLGVRGVATSRERSANQPRRWRQHIIVGISPPVKFTSQTECQPAAKAATACSRGCQPTVYNHHKTSAAKAVTGATMGSFSKPTPSFSPRVDEKPSKTDFCHRFAAWGLVAFSNPWADTHGYMLTPLRG